MRIDIADWQLGVQGASFIARPSLRTVLRQGWVSVLAAVLALLLYWQFGLPPGSRQLERRWAQVQKLEKQAQAARQQAQRVAGSATASDPRSVSRQMAQSLDRNADELETRARRQRDALAGARPTLGPVGDALVWSAWAALALAAVGLPALTPLARVSLHYDGPPGRGTLTVRQSLLISRTRRFDVSRFLVLGLHVQRLIATRHDGVSPADHGWVWQVLLFTDDARDPVALSFWVEHHDTLPPDGGMITARARELVRYLEAVTVLEVGRPVVTDVTSMTPTWGGWRWALRSRRVEPRPASTPSRG